MRQLSIGTIELPKIYVVDNVKDLFLCKQHGLPYLVWHGKHEDLVKLVLYPTLVKMFPGIKWNKVLGIKEAKQQIVHVPGGKYTGEHKQTKDEVYHDSGIADIAQGERLFDVEGGEMVNDMKLDDYIGDLSTKVNIEELQDLHLLPAFLDEITSNIKKNLYDLAWWEGYNKKLGVPLGNFSGGSEAPNLMILDVSGSIPRSISATMITLIDTLRQQANADLIITSSMSKFYPIGSKLPDPQEIRNIYGPKNESVMFKEILKNEVIGKTYSNVISFGDDDTPLIEAFELDWGGTVIHHVWHYHTGFHYRNRGLPYDTGYAKWTKNIMANEANIHYNTSWCSIME